MGAVSELALTIKLAPPRLPAGWTEELQSDGSILLRVPNRERAGSAYNGWAVPLFAGAVVFSCCGGLMLGPLWWMPLTLAAATWVGHLAWLVGSGEYLEVTSGCLEVRPSLLGLALPKSSWREAELEVVGPDAGEWDLRVASGTRRRRLCRSTSLDAVLGLASHLQDITGWRVHYGTGLRPIFPQVLDIASASSGTTHWRLLFRQPVLYLGFADALKNQQQRPRMLAALRQLEGEVPLLLKALEHPDGGIRQAALELLTAMEDRAVLPPARALLTDPSLSLRLQAVTTLGMLRDEEAVPLLCDLLRGDTTLLNAAIPALAAIGDRRAVPTLCDLLRSSRSDYVSDTARLACQALGELGDPEALPVLGLILQQGAPAAKGAAAAAMGQIGHASALPALRLAVVDAEPLVRFSAAQALGRLNTPDAVPALASALHDDTPNVRIAATASLGVIGDPAAIEALCRALENQPALVRRDAAVRLGHLAGREGVSPISLRAAVPALERLSAPLSTETAEVKRACREALQRIEDGTGHMKRLPVPAAPGESRLDSLPRPSEPPPG